MTDDPNLITSPGGMATVRWEFPSEPTLTDPKWSGYFNIDFFVTVTFDPGKKSYFWSHQFFFTGTDPNHPGGNGPGGYIGLQGIGAVKRWDPATKTIEDLPDDRVVVFSIWNALGATASPDSFAAPFGGEGGGWKCVLRYPWVPNARYCFRIWLVTQTPEEIQQGVRRWTGVLISTDEQGQETHHFIGDITVPVSWFGLQKSTNAFTEYYTDTVTPAKAVPGDPPPACTAMPFAAIEFHPPLANNRTIAVLSTEASAYGPCAAVSRFFAPDKVASGTVFNRPVTILNKTGLEPALAHPV